MGSNLHKDNIEWLDSAIKEKFKREKNEANK